MQTINTGAAMGQVLTVDQRPREVRKTYDPDVEIDISKIDPADLVARDRARRRIMHEDMVEKQSILVLQDAVASCYRQYGAQNAPYKCRDVNIEYLRRISHQAGWGGWKFDFDKLEGKSSEPIKETTE